MIALACAPVNASSGPKQPIDSILGFHLGVAEATVRPALEKLGTRYRPRHGEWARAEGAGKELWVLKDPRYQFLMVMWDEERRLRKLAHWHRAVQAAIAFYS